MACFPESKILIWNNTIIITILQTSLLRLGDLPKFTDHVLGGLRYTSRTTYCRDQPWVGKMQEEFHNALQTLKGFHVWINAIRYARNPLLCLHLKIKEYKKEMRLWYFFFTYSKLNSYHFERTIPKTWIRFWHQIQSFLYYIILCLGKAKISLSVTIW